jgi:hypothetical protein
MKKVVPLIIAALLIVCVVSPTVSIGEPLRIHPAAEPDIWVSPNRFDFAVVDGQTDSDILTIGNNGTLVLNYVILGAGAKNRVLVLDGAPSGSTEVIDALIANGYDVTIGGVPSTYTGSPDPILFDLIMLLIGDDYTDDMPNPGQTAIESFVNNGGPLIMTEWVGYHVQNGRYAIIAPMIAMSRSGGNNGVETCTIAMSHPVTDGVPSPFTTVPHSFGVMNARASTTILVDGNMANDELGFRPYGSGMVVHFATVGKDSFFNAWTDPDLLQLMLNSADWLTNNSASFLPDWISVTPGSGSIPPPGTVDHTVTVNTTTLSPGEYTANITIENNDPDENPKIVPVNLTVLAPHNVKVKEMTLVGYPETGKPMWIDGTILNMGSEVETNIEVRFLVNFGLENTTIIVLLISTAEDAVSFMWVPPLAAQYTLSLYVVPVPGETIIFNNWWNQTINVTDQPDIWVNPISLSFTVPYGQNDTYNITIGNDGLASLNYKISGLSHRWKLDETVGSIAYDSTGDCNGTIYNALINQPGKYGNSYWFDGSDDYVQIDDDNSLDFNAGEDFSIYAWIKTDIRNCRLLSKRDVPGSARGYLLEVVGTNFAVFLDDGSSGAYVRGTANISDGQWHHVGMLRSGDTLEAFVDGASIGTDNNAGGNLSNDNPLLLGVEQTIVQDYRGYLDDVLMYYQATTPYEVYNETEWLSVSPNSGSLFPFGSTDHAVTVDATILDPGFYQTNITINSNDPNEGVLVIPVSLNVTIQADVPLQEGWNLVSVPLIQNDTAIDEVLSSITGKWDYIMAYNSSSPDPWKSNRTSRHPSLNNLLDLDHTMGFWINVTEANVNLTVYGLVNSSIIPLLAGWNLVGYPTLDADVTVGIALAGTGADMIMISDSSEPYNIKEVGPAYVMQPGEGYWIHVPSDTLWTIDW